MSNELSISHMISKIEQLDLCLKDKEWRRSSAIEIDQSIGKYEVNLTISTEIYEEDDND
jgi:hypothetical protein